MAPTAGFLADAPLPPNCSGIAPFVSVPRARLKQSVEAFARIVNVLTAENDRLAQKSGRSSRTVIPLNPVARS